jgi:hypothetical protein
MKRIILAGAVAVFASAAFANPQPVTNTSKAPYKASKTYCNDAVFKPSKGENIACYNHDACYSDPQGKSRSDCDEGYLRDMKLAGLEAIGWVKYKALRQWGKASWERCRENDKRQAAK